MDEPIARLQEIPVWMLDPVACGAMRAIPQPVGLSQSFLALGL